jgi:hypothetical protein
MKLVKEGHNYFVLFKLFKYDQNYLIMKYRRKVG